MAPCVGRTHTVMIMRREAAVIVAPKVGKVQKIADLQNATIGVTREGPLDGSLMAPVLDYYGITRDKARYVALQGDEIANAFRQKKIDAMIAVGPVTSKQMGEAIADAARGIKGAIQFIEIEEADAIVKRIPALELIEIEQGAFGGRPPRPAESFNTLGYSIRLVTNTRTDTDSIAELARQLFLIRQNLSAAIPGAGLMETPDVEEASAVPGASGRARLCQRRAAHLVRQVQRLHLSRPVPRQRARLGRGRHVRLDAQRQQPQARTCRGSGSRRCSTRCAMPGRPSSSMQPSARRTRFSVRCSRWASRGNCPATPSRASISRWATCAAASRRGAAALRTG